MDKGLDFFLYDFKAEMDINSNFIKIRKISNN